MATTPVFLPEESHGQRSLAGYNPWVCKELGMTEWLPHTYSFFFHTPPLIKIYINFFFLEDKIKG